MLGVCGMAHKLDDLPIFHKAQEFCVAATDALNRSRVRRNSDRYNQIIDATDSVLANMDEGFEQGSDDGFARYLGYSKGSVAEVMRRFRRAAARGEVDMAEVATLDALAEPLGKMFGGFIKYLKRSGFKDRGRFLASQERKQLPRSKDSGSNDPRSRDPGSRDPGSKDSGSKDSG
jgi:four helix bundle protein